MAISEEKIKYAQGCIDDLSEYQTGTCFMFGGDLEDLDLSSEQLLKVIQNIAEDFMCSHTDDDLKDAAVA